MTLAIGFVVITLLKSSLTPIPALIGSSRVRIMTTIVVGLLYSYLEAAKYNWDKSKECEEEQIDDDSC